MTARRCATTSATSSPCSITTATPALEWQQNPDTVKRVLDVTQATGQMGARVWLGPPAADLLG